MSVSNVAAGAFISLPIYLGLALTVFAQATLIIGLEGIVNGGGDDDVGGGGGDDNRSCSDGGNYVLRGVCLCILVAFVFESEVRECMSFRR